ncbi:MAG TPA: right-handed parallel beta-helix repeat-containing protein [Candidatus Brocadiia bacterium]|nr:right-handed parallel beta-helix repeat-containing protein [Candidatus Brocadiia bacterium]
MNSMLALVMLIVAAGTNDYPSRYAASATVVVAAADSADRSKSRADFVCDGTSDQEEINAAIQSLPTAGGTVLLLEGTYDIRKVPGKLGGVIIDRSNVTLAGQGTSTRLIQASGQNTNVIRIIGSGVGNIIIRDLWVDANRDGNSEGQGDPNVSHDRFEFCGIKAYFQAPGGPGGDTNHDITIRDCRVMNAHRLGIMLEGRNMKVVDNVLGNAGSDSVEILTGPGEIRGNYVEITGRTHVGIGTDRADSIIMANNIIHVKEGGDIDIGFRSWAASHRHTIIGNVLTVDAGGVCRKAMDIRGEDTSVTGNVIHAAEPASPVELAITAGFAVVSGNVFENVKIVVDDATEAGGPIVVKDNIMKNSALDHRRGKLITQ